MAWSRAVLTAALSTVTGAALLGWTVFEAREQQKTVEDALSAQVNLLARSLGPGLVAASMALYELDEIITWKLLDNARLLAKVYGSDAASIDQLEPLLEANGLDTLIFLDGAGNVVAEFGEPTGPDLLQDLHLFLVGSGDELILGTAMLHEVEHLAAAARLPGGGAVLVRVEGTTAHTFARRLGVENLLQRLVGIGGVLYLRYAEEPGGHRTEVSRDGTRLPPETDLPVGLRRLDGRPIYEARVGLEAPAGRTAWLRVGLDGAPLEHAAAATRQRTLVMGVVLVMLALLGGGFAVITRLRTREREAATTAMARLQEARQRSERLASAGALAAGLAHEVRSPLNAIGLAGQRLERMLPEGSERDLASRIKSEVGRLERVLQSFLHLAKPASGSRLHTELAALALEVVQLLRVEAEEKGVRLERPTGSAVVRVDREAVRRALVNLVRNAVQASPVGGRVELRIRQDREAAWVQVLDEGSGIPEEIEDRLFEAFVSDRPTGTGLGLSLVRRIAEEHGGEITLSNRESRGAEAVLRIPLKPEVLV